MPKRAGKVRLLAIKAAEDDHDLVWALPRFLAISRDRAVLVLAATELDTELLAAPADPVLRRARTIVAGALTTSVYWPSKGRARRP